MARPVPVRGVIEGFYGPPWSHDARVELVEFIAARDMNAYVYAPKSDPKHRDRWREPYDEDETRRFGALAARCAAVGVRFGFAISPGLDIDYRDGRDRGNLLAKLTPLLERGVDWIMVAVDDVPNRPGLAAEQVELVSWLVGALPDVRVTLVPTEYVGTRPSPYLAELATGLPAEVDVMWTGPTVCSPRISATDARGWRAAVGDHPMLLWDNYPVNDTIMERELHLGPYRGRPPALSDEVDGVLCNPMLQPRASKVALATAAAYLRDPAGYDEAAAWEQAISEVGGEHADALGALAHACADGPLLCPDELRLHALAADLETAVATADWSVPVRALRDELSALRSARAAYGDGADPLAGELGPWLDQARREADAALAALRLIQQVRPVAIRDDDGAGRAAGPDAESAMIHAFALLYAWTAARDGDPIVGGARFAVHAAVVQLSDGQPGLDIDLAVRENGSAIDRLCRVALREYRVWATAPAGTAQVDGAAEIMEGRSDDRFAADPAAPVTVRSGEHATIVAAPGGPPFSDVRLS